MRRRWPRRPTRRTRTTSSARSCARRDGREFEGVNVENAAYPLGVCAEKSAIVARGRGGLPAGRPRGDRHHRVAVRWLPPVAARVPRSREVSFRARRRLDRDVRGRPSCCRHVEAPGSCEVRLRRRRGPAERRQVDARQRARRREGRDHLATCRTRRGAGSSASRNGDDYQLVLVDLPGFQRPMDTLTERMQRTVDTSFEDIDVVLFVLVGARRGSAPATASSRGASSPSACPCRRAEQGRPPEAGPHRHADEGRRRARRLPRAASGQREDEGRHRRAARRPRSHLLPEGQPLFPRESADRPYRSRSGSPSSIREKALQLTRDEVPHSISVELDELDEKLLRAFVLVETESQKQILVGKGGAMIREIGMRARPEIEPLLGRKIFLELASRCAPSGAATTRRSSGSGS